MKLIVFGATGGTGHQLIRQGLEQGHVVTAFARHPETIELSHENLRLVKGDVLDAVAVEQSIKGHDAVLCALGTPATNKKKLRSKGTKNIITAMESQDISRLICLSGMGCGDSYDVLPFHYKYLFFPLILRHVLADHEDQEKMVRGSKLDWVIVRPANLTNGVNKGSYWHGRASDAKSIALKISRADVADFMLKQVSVDSYLKAAPCLSY